MKSIVLVHGINNEGKSEDQLIGEWLGALETVFSSEEINYLRSLQIVAPYYGNTLKEITDGVGFLPEAVEQSIEDIPSQSKAFISQSLAEMALGAGLSPSLLDAETAHEVVEQSLTANRYVNFSLRFLEGVSPWNLRYGMLLLRQAYVYLNLANAADAVDTIVAPAIKQDAPSLIIAHSLGTIVSFKALREATDAPSHRYITLGSPLSLKAVKKSIGPSFDTPEAVSHWANALDQDDIVTLGRSLKSSGYGDGRLFENEMIENGHKNPHSIARYLRSNWVANEVREALAIDQT